MRKDTAPLGGFRSLQSGRLRAYTDQTHARTASSRRRANTDHSPARSPARTFDGGLSTDSRFHSVCEVREQRPFVQQADKLQQDFDYDFASYLEHLEVCLAGHKRQAAAQMHRNRKYTPAKIPSVADPLRIETPSRTNEDTPTVEVVKTLELGPKKRVSRLTFVRCDGHGGVRSTARGWLESIDVPDHWPGVNGTRPSDITNSSLRSAMALPATQFEQKLPWINYREIGAAERSLLDRTPRTNPECTRRLPPKTGSTSSTQRLDESEYSRANKSRTPSPQRSSSNSPRRTSAEEASPRSGVQWDPQLPQVSRESSITPRLRRFLKSQNTC